MYSVKFTILSFFVVLSISVPEVGAKDVTTQNSLKSTTPLNAQKIPNNSAGHLDVNATSTTLSESLVFDNAGTSNESASGTKLINDSATSFLVNSSNNDNNSSSTLGGNDTSTFDVDDDDGDKNETRNQTRRRKPGRDLSIEFQIPVFAIIFLLSVVGNVLVILTVIQNKKMRSVTNVFLLNLSVSDLLLAVFCMPFTIVPMFLQNFIFGEVMCIVIRYMQGVSVAVSCFTLVAISLERYFAICHPLKSRRWQTLSHAYKVIAVCWVLGLALMIPQAVYHKLVQFGPSRFVCAERWPSESGQLAFTMSLNLFLLVLPVIIMSWAYGCVSYTLWLGIKLDKQSENERQQKTNGSANYDCQNGVSIYVNNKKISMRSSSEDALEPPTPGSVSSHSLTSPTQPVASRPFRRFEAHRVMRQSNSEKSRAAKKRVIKMLFIIILEFFAFWTPIFVIQTWVSLDPKHAQAYISSMIKGLLHLVSYISACCNPITYCFMNKNFRQSFLMVFRCMKKRNIYAHRTQMSFSGHTASTRAPVSQSVVTSYDKIIDSDDISENSF